MITILTYVFFWMLGGFAFYISDGWFNYNEWNAKTKTYNHTRIPLPIISVLWFISVPLLIAGAVRRKFEAQRIEKEKKEQEVAKYRVIAEKEIARIQEEMEQEWEDDKVRWRDEEEKIQKKQYLNEMKKQLPYHMIDEVLFGSTKK